MGVNPIPIINTLRVPCVLKYFYEIFLKACKILMYNTLHDGPQAKGHNYDMYASITAIHEQECKLKEKYVFLGTCQN